MLFNIDFWSMEKYLPTKRHKILRERYVKHTIDVDIKEADEEEFPPAFIIHDRNSVYENAKTYEDFRGSGEYKMFTEKIRTYGGRLYKPVRISYGSAISTLFEPFEYVKKMLDGREPYHKGGNDFSESSIVKEDYMEECRKRILESAKNYLIYDGKVWKTCGEPMYEINTFGLGHNHGGTGFFICYCYNSNISRENYFNALERKEAIAYGKQVAAERGDTKYIEGMGEHDIIEVLMPEMVKRNPKKEHGKGDPFKNSIEGLIKRTKNCTDAGLLSMIACVAEMGGMG